MTVQDQIEGTCASRFGPLKDVFRENFISRGDVGAAVSVTVEGETVVDLWGGTADADGAQPWQRDTIVCTQSVSKGVTALGVHILISRGLVDIDAPVTRYWPEYGQNGKENTTVRMLLAHLGGVPVVDGATPGMGYDWKAMIEGLARTKAMWEPGTTPCYHSANYAFLIGEVLRRVSGMTVGEFIRKEIAGPLGVDFCMGLTPDEEARTARFLDAEKHPSHEQVLEGANIFARSWKIFWDDEDFNSPEWRHAQLPSVNGHTNARSLARICTMMALGGELDGHRFLGREALEQAGKMQWSQEDAQGRNMSMALGFLLPNANRPATSPGAMCMGGAGGAAAFADPDNRIGFAYTMNHMDPDPRMPRARALIEALKGIVG